MFRLYSSRYNFIYVLLFSPNITTLFLFFLFYHLQYFILTIQLWLFSLSRDCDFVTLWRDSLYSCNQNISNIVLPFFPITPFILFILYFYIFLLIYYIYIFNNIKIKHFFLEIFRNLLYPCSFTTLLWTKYNLHSFLKEWLFFLHNIKNLLLQKSHFILILLHSFLLITHLSFCLVPIQHRIKTVFS